MADIVWSTTTLPDAVIGAAYEGSFAVTGNASAITAATVSSGSLPPGLAIDADQVRITGTPTAKGTYTFQITLTDTAGSVQSGQFTIVCRYADNGDREWLSAEGNLAAAEVKRQWP